MKRLYIILVITSAVGNVHAQQHSRSIDRPLRYISGRLRDTTTDTTVVLRRSNEDTSRCSNEYEPDFFKIDRFYIRGGPAFGSMLAVDAAFSIRLKTIQSFTLAAGIENGGNIPELPGLTGRLELSYSHALFSRQEGTGSAFYPFGRRQDYNIRYSAVQGWLSLSYIVFYKVLLSTDKDIWIYGGTGMRITDFVYFKSQRRYKSVDEIFSQERGLNDFSKSTSSIPIMLGVKISTRSRLELEYVWDNIGESTVGFKRRFFALSFTYTITGKP